jgi:hypothetical protein
MTDRKVFYISLDNLDDADIEKYIEYIKGLFNKNK